MDYAPQTPLSRWPSATIERIVRPLETRLHKLRSFHDDVGDAIQTVKDAALPFWDELSWRRSLGRTASRATD
jgi:hypothetical protein